MSIAEKESVAFCGLYCGACPYFKNKKCNGCQKNEKATWCKIRSCCYQNGYGTCADCKEFSNPQDCRKFNNFISKIFALIFKSNRVACIEQIKKHSIEKYAAFMDRNKLTSMKKNVHADIE